MSSGKPLFELMSVRFHHGSHPAIDGIDLDIQPGRLYGILGPNGSGKTTLLDLLVRHRKPQFGTIRFDNRDMASISRKELARNISLVPQSFDIRFPFSVRDIVSMGRYPYASRFGGMDAEEKEFVERILVETGLGGFANRPVTDLSGGERQRVVFARALAQNTPVLLLDEATSNLDIHQCIHLMNRVRARVVEWGRTVIAAIQDISLAAMYCDALIVLQQGKVVAFGDTADVLTPELLADVFRVRALIDRTSEGVRVAFDRRLPT
ncbi:MAG: ABC transporter ATP-binding protein [Thermodesulfobacteriota bacterium]